MIVSKHVIPLVSCFLLLSLLMACGDALDQQSKTTITDEPLESPVITPSTSPVRGMPFADEASRYFSNYFTHYRTYFPDMTFDDFVPTDTFDHPSFYQHEKPVDLLRWVPDFGAYAYRSPNEQYWLDVVSYDITKTAGGEWIAASPDSEVALIQAMTGDRTRLMLCGSACSFAEGFWMDDETIVVAGLLSEATGYKPTLWHIDLAERRIVTYIYPWALREGQTAYSVLPG